MEFMNEQIPTQSNQKIRIDQLHFTIKGCDSNFEVNIFQILKVATNETTTLH